MQTLHYTEMKAGTAEQYARLLPLEEDYVRALPDRILAAVARLDSATQFQGLGVSCLTHSLQTATRAERDGADAEWIVAALLHDLGQELATENHSQYAASILKPYVRAEVTWVVNMHGLFQMQFYAHHFGRDPNGHLAFRDHPWFDSCQRFCERWDQTSFDPGYATEPLSHFEPLVRAVFSRKAFDPLVLNEPAA